MITPPLFNFEESILHFQDSYRIHLSSVEFYDNPDYFSINIKILTYKDSFDIEKPFYKINELIALPFKKIKNHIFKTKYINLHYLEYNIFLIYTLQYFKNLNAKYIPLNFKEEPFYFIYVLDKKFGQEIFILTEKQYEKFSKTLPSSKSGSYKIYVKRRTLHIT